MSKTPTGGAPALSIAVDPATNHIVGQTYDGNGNQTSTPYPAVYDAGNRLEFISSAGVHYRYDSRNKRIWKSTLSAGNLAQEVYFYGVDGQKLGTYTLQLFLDNSNVAEITDSNTGLAIFFGGKRLGTYDRLGTAKFNSNGQQQSFYPYGEDRGTVQPNDSLKFATYTRDTATGLDYADQRYYANNFGRFMSPDRGGAAATNPGSWNRYSYVQGDPANYLDPRGLFALHPEAAPGFRGGGYGTGGDGGDGGGGGDGSCGPDWMTNPSLQGPCCPASGAGFAPGDPSPSPFCPAPPPPPPPPVQPYCSIDVAESGTPRDGQDVTNIGAPTNDLGLVTTLTSAQLFVQIQADLFGDTNARDWQSYQTASVTGTYQNTQGGPTVITNINRPDDGPSAGVIYYGQGTYDWLDYPGVNPFPGYKMTETFSFTSILTNKRNAFATCVVSWGFTLSDVQGRWSLVGFW